jgi:hypothetical protein
MMSSENRLPHFGITLLQSLPVSFAFDGTMKAW